MSSPTQATFGTTIAPPIAGEHGNDPVRQAIADASRNTSVDFNYLLAQAQIESSLNPQAKASTSSASGLYQFISSTWLSTVDRHGAKHGLDWAAAAITKSGGSLDVSDPQLRSEILALRHNPDIAAVMAAELAQDNSDALRPILGREPRAPELYLAHFLGAGGARRFLSAMREDAGQLGANLFPRPAAANKAIFFDQGRPRSLAGIMDLIRGKLDRALLAANNVSPSRGGSVPAFGSYAASHTKWGSYFSADEAEGAAEVPHQNPHQSNQRPSMADTLKSTFGGVSELPEKAGEQVDAAYKRIKAFKL